jgi:hypothetical protein
MASASSARVGYIQRTSPTNAVFSSDIGQVLFWDGSTSNQVFGCAHVGTNVYNKYNVNGEWLSTSYADYEFTIPIAEWAGSGTVNLAQNDVQYYYSTGNTWGTTNSSATTSQGQGGVLGGTTTPAGISFTYTFTPTSPIPVSAKPVIELSLDGIHWSPAGMVTASILIENLRYDGTNYIGAVAYLNATGQIVVTFGKYCQGTTTAWSGTWYWRVVVAQPGQAVGFGIVNPGTSSGLVAAAGLPGNTTGNAVAAGYVGEVKTSTSSLVVYSASATWENVANLTMTAGLWLVSGAVGDLYNSSSSGADLEVAISGYSGSTTTDHTAYFNAWSGVSTPTNTSNAVLTAMPVFVRSDGTNLYIGSSTIAGQTLYLKSRVTYTGTAHTRAGTITAARIA